MRYLRSITVILISSVLLQGCKEHHFTPPQKLTQIKKQTPSKYPVYGKYQGDPAPYSSEKIAAKNYRGVTLHILTHTPPVMGEPTIKHAKMFEKLTGARLIIHHVPFHKLYSQLLFGLKQQQYDIVFFGSLWLTDLTPHLLPLPQKMIRSQHFQDLLPHYRDLARWGEHYYQVPIDGDRHYLQYRRDLLGSPAHQQNYFKQTGRQLKIPRTWKELHQIASYFHGKKDFQRRTLSGMVEITDHRDLLFSQFIKRAAPYMKHPDLNAIFFNPETMAPLINQPGFVEALKDMVALSKRSPQKKHPETLSDVINIFGKGYALFSDSWDDAFIQAMEPESGLSSHVAAAPSPGSRKVWHWGKQRWESFPDINYAPYIAWGWSSGVSRYTKHPEATFNFLGFFANHFNHQRNLLIGRFGVNPFKKSDLNPDFWINRAGWNPDIAHSYINTLKIIHNHPNRVTDLRIHLSAQYMKALSTGLYRALSKRDSPQKALDVVAQKWRQLTKRVGVDKQRKAYLKHLKRVDNVDRK